MNTRYASRVASSLPEPNYRQPEEIGYLSESTRQLLQGYEHEWQ